MKQSTLLLFVLLLSITTTLFSQIDIVKQHGHLQVQGNTIIDKNEIPTQLRGMSFFWSQWMGQFYNANVVKTLAEDWKCTVVRAAMGIDVENDGYLRFPTSEKQKVETIIQAAIDNGIYVIVDWHSHHAEDQTEEAIKFFGYISQKYGHYDNIIYELYNEPLQVSWSDVIKPYCEAVMDTIRANDPDNMIICGTGTWSQDVDKASLDPIIDTNVAYTLHYYAATHKQGLRDKAQTALDNGIALFVTEFGTCEASGDGDIDHKESLLWWDFLEKNHISWANWSVADKDESASILNPNADSKGQWDESDLTESGILVRDELRQKYTYQYNNTESTKLNIPTFKTIALGDSIDLTSSLTSNEETLADSLVYNIAGGTIDSNNFYHPNRVGVHRLFVTNYKNDTIQTSMLFRVVDTSITNEFITDTIKTFLSLYDGNSNYLSTKVDRNFALISPSLNDTLKLTDKTLQWKKTTSEGVFSDTLSTHYSYFSTSIYSPKYQIVNLSYDHEGSFTLYVNAKTYLIKKGQNTIENLELQQGENIISIAHTGRETAAGFSIVLDKAVLTSILSKNELDLNYIYDCSGLWKGSAILDSCLSCIGGNTGLTACKPRTSYRGNLITVPGRIEAEHYDNGGANHTYFDTDAINQGDSDLRNDGVDVENTLDTDKKHNVGWMADGEWLEYSVFVEKTAEYNLLFRIASNLGTSALALKVDNKNVTGTVNIPSTKGWQTWEDVLVEKIKLDSGLHIFRLEVVSPWFNINYIDVISLEKLGINNTILDETITISPNPSQGSFKIQSEEFKIEKIEIYGSNGILIQNINKVNEDIIIENAGLYHVKIITETGIITKKVVIE